MTSKSSLLIATFLLAAKWGSAAKCSDVVGAAARLDFCAESGSVFVTDTRNLDTACCEDICGTCRKDDLDTTEKSPCCTTGTVEAAAKAVELDTAVDALFDDTITQVTDVDGVTTVLTTLSDIAAISATPKNEIIGIKTYTNVFLKEPKQREAFQFRINQETKNKAATAAIRQKYQKKDAPLRLKAIKKAAAKAAVKKEEKRQEAFGSCNGEALCEAAFSKKTTVTESKITLVADDLPPAILERIKTAQGGTFQAVEMVVATNKKVTVDGVETIQDDQCNTDASGDDCCTYDIGGDSGLTMLSVAEEIGSWGVLCEGDKVLAKMTQIAAEDTYSIACYDNAINAWGTAEDKTTGSVKNCNDKDILIGSITATDPPTTTTTGGSHYGVPVYCLDPSVQVHVLNGLSVVATTVDKLKVGDVVVGEGRTSAIQNIERWKVDVETCVVPADLCAAPATLRHKNNVRILHKHKHPEIIVSENHAVRCPSWPANVWTFCDDDWERRRSSELVHVELESYVEDHLMSGNVVLESWDGYTRVETDIADVCEHGGCPWSHEWMELPSQADEVVKYVRKDLRLSTFKSGKKWKLINAEKMEQCMQGWLSLSASD